jgi:DNA replication protein DnaC
MTETEEPTNMAPIFKERLEQFKAAGERYARECQKQEDPNAPSIESLAADLIEKGLLSKGFPYRHVLQLGAMKGKSLEVAQSMKAKIVSGDCLIILVGNLGPGKTQMATYWARLFISAVSPLIRYVKCADLIGEIKATWHDGGRKIGTESDVLLKYRRAKYLVIDEFRETRSDWEKPLLDQYPGPSL